MHPSSADGSEKLSRISLALFRIGFGLLWLDMAFQKAPWIVQDGNRFGWLYGWIQNEIAHPTFTVYKWFLQSIVLPNFTLFGFLTFLTETALGLSLLLGVFTVLGGIGGALWQVNIALGSFSVPGEWPWTWFLLIAPQLVFAATRAGRTLGMDERLLARLSRGGKAQAGLRRIFTRLG
jgi:thiosulfate dehydrogenase [quinone] large subunit